MALGLIYGHHGVPKKTYQKGYNQLAQQLGAQEIIHKGWLSLSEISITQFLIHDQNTLIYNLIYNMMSVTS